MTKIEILNDVSIDGLKPYPGNIFNHKNVQDIANSIRDFGYNKLSIGVDEDNVLLYGHGTLEAIKLLEWDKVPMVAKIVGLNDEKKKAYRIADNTTNRNTHIIKNLLQEEMQHQTE